MSARKLYIDNIKKAGLYMIPAILVRLKPYQRQEFTHGL